MASETPIEAPPRPGASLLDGLNEQQRRAAEATSGPVRILAGAGSGKTRTITHRIAHQIATGVARPDQVLAVTFTERAAAEMRERLGALGISGPVRATTFHAAAWAQLRFFWPRVNDRPAPEVLSSKVGMLTPLARHIGVDAKDLASEIEWAKARRLDPAGYVESAADRDGPAEPERVADAYARYESAKRDANLIDYEDMLLGTLALFEEHGEVAATVRDRYRFFTVDEFQDLNPAQWSLLRAWLGERDEVCVVGDDDQMIYRFTGASASYLVDFRRHYPRAVEVTLVDNYRSTPQVLDLANRVLAQRPGGTTKRLRATAGDGTAPELRSFADGAAEVGAVVAAVRRLLADGVVADEIAICYRINSQSEPFEQALGEAGIPFVVRGASSFYELDGVRQGLRVLRAAATRTDDGSQPPAPGGALPAQPPPVTTTVERVLREHLSWRADRPPRGRTLRERWENIRALTDLVAAEVEANPGMSFPDVVATFSARAAAARDDRGRTAAVTLLSLHKAKGLEFDAVFIVSVEDGLIPITYAFDDDDALEEERRLLYVGLTRARCHLWVSWAQSRARGSRSVRRTPSRFLDGLRPGGRRKVAERTRAPDSPEVEALRRWRAERARRDGKPAFVVFSDRTLHALLTDRPRDETELLEVHGFGPAKVATYGEEVLAILRAPR